MIDGIHFEDHVVLAALGIDAQGQKHVLRPRAAGREVRDRREGVAR